MSITRLSDAEAGPPLLLEEGDPSLLSVGYPLRLSLKDRPVEFADEMTAREFFALQNTLKFIRKQWHEYSLQLYIDFYTENHNLINRFRSKKTGKICAMVFASHAKRVFNIFRDIIEHGLWNWDRSRNKINAFTRIHVARNISLADITLLANAFRDMIMEKCTGITSASVTNGLEKLYNEMFKQHRAREIVGSDDMSLDMAD